MTRRVSILGSTGSVGSQAVELLRAAGNDCEVVALTGYRNISTLVAQAQALRPAVVVTGDEAMGAQLERELAGSGLRTAAGPQAVVEAAGMETDICIAAIVGKVGLASAVAALGRTARLGLANKECLVAAGELFMRRAQDSSTEVVPLDSEHSALARLLAAHGRVGLSRVILTASGGPFWRSTMAEMATVTAAEAVKHPTWQMGQRISIDSASMFNKAIEIIEAHHLFGLPSDMIEVLVHPQCVVHGIVEYADQQSFAQLAPARMDVVIASAFGWEIATPASVPLAQDLAAAPLEFAEPDTERFPALRLARDALARGGLAGCVLNAAREEASAAFVAGKIGFLDMATVVEETMTELQDLGAAATFEDVDAADRQARDVARRLLATRGEGSA